MSSWQQYVDNLMSTGNMTACGIFGLDGSTWAASNNFPIKTDGVKLIIASVSDSSKIANGLQVDNERYILIRSDPGLNLVLKKGPNSIVAYKSSQSIIIGIHDGSVKAEKVVTDIGRMSDYLVKHGY